MKNKEFDNILNDCLERLLIKGESLEQCIEHYPNQADELRPLLETTLVAKEASAIEPRPDFRARAAHQFRAALEERAASKSRTSWGWFPRWATVVAIVLVLVLGGGGGTVVAADSSMPDSALYPVKLTTEQVRLTLTFSQMGKAGLCAELADERVAEIAYMAEKGDAEQVELITRRLDKRLAMLAVLVLAQKEGEEPMLMAPPTPTEETPPGPAPAPQPGKGRSSKDESDQNDNRVQLRNTLVYDAVHNQAVLNAALDRAPEQTRAALRRAIMVSEDGYEEVLEALEQE